jgi:hypothetical protein
VDVGDNELEEFSGQDRVEDMEVREENLMRVDGSAQRKTKQYITLLC